MAYTYYLEWTKTGMKYYGARWAEVAHPDDLFVTYFTSSTYVKRYMEEHGKPDIIQIRKTFACSKSCQIFEHKVLDKIRAVDREDYLNKYNRIKGWDSSDPEIRAKQSKSTKSRWAKDSNYRKTMIESNKRRKGSRSSDYTKRKISEGMKGKSFPCTDKKRRAISEGRQRNIKLKEMRCPECDLHFSSCFDLIGHLLSEGWNKKQVLAKLSQVKLEDPTTLEKYLEMPQGQAEL